jgi:hypothetical protein
MQLSTTDLGLLFAALTTLVLFTGGVVSILVGLKKLWARNPETEAATRADFAKLENLIHKLMIDVALLEKALENGLKVRVQSLEDRLNHVLSYPAQSEGKEKA